MGRQPPPTYSQSVGGYLSDEARGSSDDESNDDEETKQTPGIRELEDISSSHDKQLLDLLNKDGEGALPNKLAPNVFESGKGGMTILHKILLITCRSSRKPRNPSKPSPRNRSVSSGNLTPLSAGRIFPRPVPESSKPSKPSKPLELYKPLEPGKIPFETFRPLVTRILSSEEGPKLLFKVDDSLYGQTALRLAINLEKWEALECLLNSEESLDAAVLPPKHGSSNCLHEVIKVYMSKRWGSTSTENGGELLWKCIKKLVSKPETTKKFYTNPIKGDGGNTPLHLAVAYKEAMSPKNQEKLILELIRAYPESMKICNDAGQSPYQYRKQTMKVKEDNDKILFDLKDHYMHYKDRNEAIECLYGVGEEVAMELDLSEHTNYPLRTKSLDHLGGHLELENILRYVDFPKIVVEQTRDQEVGTEPGRQELEQEQGVGRKDIKLIFNWLREQGVKKIIKVRVDDTADPPHSDEVIETALADFGVEVWDWIKIDLCSNTIFKAAPNLTEVFLYSSGNNAVLQAWSGDDGLKKLSKLKLVHLVIYQKLESLERTKEYSNTFRDRLCSRINGIVVDSKVIPLGKNQQGKLNPSGENDPEQTHMWITYMNDFVNFVSNINTSDLKPKPVKVALIDDGVDGAHEILCDRIKGGISFCSRNDSKDHVYSYCVPSGCHGTQMAGLICQVCPQIELYVARIQEHMGEGGNRQIDAPSVVKAIDWAIAQDVDIISMSWTFQRTKDNKSYLGRDLRKAVSRAVEKDILMFCSTGDMGKCGNDKIYPACLPSVFSIGAAKSSGNKWEWTESSSHFMFPGEDLIAEIPTYLESKTKPQVSGSSLATALASGLAALVLYCNEIACSHQTRESVRNYPSMKRVFKNMVNSDYPKYVRAWEHLKPEFKNYGEEEDGINELKKTITELFR